MAKRTDQNQAEIVQALRSVGATVQSLHTVGKGCPDLLVGYRGKNYLMEVKTRVGRLTKDEQDWFTNWGGVVEVVKTPGAALLTIGAMVLE